MDGEINISLRVKWRTLGAVRLDRKRKLVFPRTTGAQVYRLSIEKFDGARSIYIGETENFEQRFAMYRSPGATQWTNRRLNQLCTDVLGDLGTILLEIVDQAWIDADGIEREIDFRNKHKRRLLENLVLTIQGGQDVESLNR
jgi:hypothetical protein